MRISLAERGWDDRGRRRRLVLLTLLYTPLPFQNFPRHYGQFTDACPIHAVLPFPENNVILTPERSKVKKNLNF
jgi:hypothetical protein